MKNESIEIPLSDTFAIERLLGENIEGNFQAILNNSGFYFVEIF